MSGWKDAAIVAEPVGANEEGTNKGGLAIFLYNTTTGKNEEVARIAYDREEGGRKDVSFNEAVDLAVDIARKCVSTIKMLFEMAGKLQ